MILVLCRLCRRGCRRRCHRRCRYSCRRRCRCRCHRFRCYVFEFGFDNCKMPNDQNRSLVPRVCARDKHV